MFHNEVQLGKELKAKRSNSYDKYVTFNIQVVLREPRSDKRYWSKPFNWNLNLSSLGVVIW